MKNKIIKIIIAIVVVVSYLLIIFGALFKLMHWTGADEMLKLAIGSQILVIIVYFINIILSPISKKWAWIIGGLLNPFGCAIIYYFNKNDLIKLKELKDKGEI
jgi:hypothetical protein